MHRRHVNSIVKKLLICVLGLLVLPADAAQATGHFNITINFQSGVNPTQPTTSSVQSVSRSALVVRPADSFAQFTASSVALGSAQYLGGASISKRLGAITYWRMVNLHSSNNDPDRSYLEMLIGW